MANNHQFWAPRRNDRGDRPRNVQLWAIIGSSNAPWPYLGSGQGHVNIYSTYRTTCMLNHVTVVSHTAEIWPFEFRQISILDEVWTLVIAFLDGNSHTMATSHQFWAPRRNGRGDRKVHFSQLRKLRDLDFDLRSGYNNNNNNNPICKAPECQKTSVALADRNSRAN